jgi:hypothetical protein
MSILKDTLTLLETRLQALVEGSAARLFTSEELQNSLARRLVEAMQAEARTHADGSLIAPNLYTVRVHPSQRQRLDPDPELLEQLAQSLQGAAVEAGLIFLSPAVIRLVEDEAISPQQFEVQAQVSLGDLAQTTALLVEPAPETPTVPANAFLIVNGTRIFPLTQPVVNIGRRPDNHLVIDDRRVSRVHAQLRAIKGRYVIFDLDSRGGTFVNDQPVHQSVLYPGDVISLAGVPLVFGQEETRVNETQKLDAS